jgi:glycosyltransferase involved in cell wall biosynthesis
VKITLAIVIPAFRNRHLAETLESLATQTDQRFRVYIGDDASPDPIAECVARFNGRLLIDYHRFAENIGGHNLVAQWHRCIDRTRGEPWIWLFSDDDIAEPECVERFFQEASRNDVDLFRFGMDIINDRSIHRSRPHDHPQRETSLDLLRSVLTDRTRAWRAQDHIFSRSAYIRHGGFVVFPNAIYSDYATWIKLSAERGICTIRGPRVRWRSHPLGTSTGRREWYRQRWIQSLGMFMRWLQAHAAQNGASDVFEAHALHFFFRDLTALGSITADERKAAIKFAREIFGGTWANATIQLYLTLFKRRLMQSEIVRQIRRMRSILR